MSKKVIDFSQKGKYNKTINFPIREKIRGDRRMATNSKKLRELRIVKGLEQKEMAALLGYKSLTKYNEIENGHRELPINKAVKAAKILGCSLDDIFFT